MREVLFCASVLAFCTNQVQNANILAIFPLPGYSHFIMYRTVVEELVRKGHTVDMYSPFPLKEPLNGYNDHSFAELLPTFVNNFPVFMVENSNPKADITFLTTETTKYCDILLSSPMLQELMKSHKKYDVFMTETFGSECMFAFGHHFQIPTIGFTSSVDLPWGGSKIGNPDNPSYIPTYYSPYLAEMSFSERVWNTITLLHTKYLHYMGASVPGNKIVKQYFGPNTPDLNTLVSNISLLMVNSHFSIHQARPLVPNFIEIGGVHIKDPKPLNDEALKKLVEGPKPVIFFSIGSMVLSETIPKDKLQALFNAFQELPYTVLWKGNKTKFPQELDFPDNVHFLPWVPQLNLLCHPNVKLFISHGGLMGLQEAIFCGTPILGIPIFADQKLNIQQAEKSGYAIPVGYHDITKETILNAARKLLEEPIYLENARTKSMLFRDRISKPLETAVFWIEYVIRHKGAPHLRSVAASLPLYQYYLLDVVFVLFGIPLIILTFLLIRLRKVKTNTTTKIKGQ